MFIAVAMNSIGFYGQRSNSELHLITMTLKGRSADIRVRNPPRTGRKQDYGETT